MKAVSIVLLLSLVSCAGVAPRSYKQKCAAKGMLLSGITSRSGGTTNTMYSYQTNTAYNTYGSYSGEDVSCEVPRTPVDKCKVVEIDKSATPIYQYNEWSDTKDLATGLGYAAFVVPGVVMKFAFEEQKQKAMNEAAKMEQEGEAKCEEMERMPASK